MKINALSKATGKSVPYLSNLIKRYNINTTNGFAEGHLVLIRKILALNICAVPAKEIEQLLTRERKLLELMRVDSLHHVPEWFELLCCFKSGPTRLLLSGYDLGTEVTGNAVQPGLDFCEREQELFKSHEMGADVLFALNCYVESLNSIKKRLKNELPVIESAMKWSYSVLS